MRSRHIAVDLGASGGRVALGTVADGRLEVEVLHRFPNGGVQRGTGLYWDIDRLWSDILLGMSKAAAFAPIASVGVNCWGVDYALLDEADQLLEGVRHYRDARTDGEMERVFERVPRSQIYARTGIQFMQLNTLYQLTAQKREGPDVLQHARTLLLLPDLLHFWLSGKKVSERTIASTTQCFDPVRSAWSDELLNGCGIASELFQPIVQPGTVLGPLRNEIASRTELQGVQVVAPASHDTASAVAATPGVGDDWAYVSSGTWSLVGVELPAPIIDERSLGPNLTNEAGIGGTTRLLKNIVGLWILQECRRAWGDPPFAELYREAAEAECELEIDPDDARFLQPSDTMPQLVEAFTGQKMTRGEITLCVLRSLANKIATVTDQLQQVMCRPIRTLNIVGGGSQIELLNQLTADASGRTVVAGPVEATLQGNLLVQAEALGSIEPGTIRDVVRRSNSLKIYEPRLLH